MLDSLKDQTLARDVWELVLIDNASAVPLRCAWDLSWHQNARHVREEEIGLTAARLRGIEESRGDLLIFIDDDNVLASDFLEQALILATQRPDLGAFGAGILEPEFEVKPAPEVVPLLPRLAIRRTDSPLWSNNPVDPACCPWGAGMCATRQVALQYYQVVQELRKIMTLGRQGQRLSSNEDDLFSWVTAKMGKGFGIFPELRITHLIPADRLTRRYMLRLRRDSRFSEGILDYLLYGIEQRPIGLPIIARVILSGLRGGLWGLRLRWAAACGESAAARFIVKSRLRQVEDLNITSVSRDGEGTQPSLSEHVVQECIPTR